MLEDKTTAMNSKCPYNRVRSRHEGDPDAAEMMKVRKCKRKDQPVDQTVFDHFERAGDEEPNCSEVMVDPDMRPEDVARIVLEKVYRK